MKTLEVKVNDSKVTFNVPTKLSEITKEWLMAVTSGINPAPNYSLIALVLRDNFAMLFNSKQKNNQTVAGVSLFVRTNADDNYLEGLECGTPIIVAPSDIAMGNHIVSAKNSITSGKVLSMINGDEELRKNVFLNRETIYTVEFKMIPNCAIHGDIIEDKAEFEDPFVKVITANNIVLD